MHVSLVMDSAATIQLNGAGLNADTEFIWMIMDFADAKLADIHISFSKCLSSAKEDQFKVPNSHNMDKKIYNLL